MTQDAKYPGDAIELSGLAELMKSFLVHLFGFPAMVIHGDTLVLDRWLWLRQQLPSVSYGSKRLLDVGCGTGAFTVGAALRGYKALGLSWDKRNQVTAQQRAAMCKADLANFEVLDVRYLDQRTDLESQFDVIVCCETIEHILNDHKLMSDMARCLKPGATLLLTTPNYDYRPMTREDDGPFSAIEDGGHVRRGYTAEDLDRLCGSAGLQRTRIDYCSGFASQKITALQRKASVIRPLIGWALVLPLRLIPPLVDPWLSRISGWPGYSIVLVAIKLGSY